MSVKIIPTNRGNMTIAMLPVIRALDQTVPIEIYDHEFLPLVIDKQAYNREQRRDNQN